MSYLNFQPRIFFGFGGAGTAILASAEATLLDYYCVPWQKGILGEKKLKEIEERHGKNVLDNFINLKAREHKSLLSKGISYTFLPRIAFIDLEAYAPLFEAFKYDGMEFHGLMNSEKNIYQISTGGKRNAITGIYRFQEHGIKSLKNRLMGNLKHLVEPSPMGAKSMYMVHSAGGGASACATKFMSELATTKIEHYDFRQAERVTFTILADLYNDTGPQSPEFVAINEGVSLGWVKEYSTVPIILDNCGVHNNIETLELENLREYFTNNKINIFDKGNWHQHEQFPLDAINILYGRIMVIISTLIGLDPSNLATIVRSGVPMMMIPALYPIVPNKNENDIFDIGEQACEKFIFSFNEDPLNDHSKSSPSIGESDACSVILSLPPNFKFNETNSLKETISTKLGLYNQSRVDIFSRISGPNEGPNILLLLKTKSIDNRFKYISENAISLLEDGEYKNGVSIKKQRGEYTKDLKYLDLNYDQLKVLIERSATGSIFPDRLNLNRKK